MGKCKSVVNVLKEDCSIVQYLEQTAQSTELLGEGRE
jgi:hypothetical protein